MISFQNVGKTYHTDWTRMEIHAVSGVTLEIAAGEVLGIAGPNGAGKSTLISMLLGYLPPTSGEVRIDGRTPRAFIEDEGIGYLSELVAIPPAWKTHEALRRYAILAGVPSEQIAASVEAAIARLGLEEHRNKRIKALSKGNLQRVGLAQALLRDQRVVILDEPTHGLDPVWTQKFRELVSDLRHPSRAILIASHNLDELERVADRVAILDGGKLQRVVTVRGDGRAANGPVVYRLQVASGLPAVQAAFPQGTTGPSGEWEVTMPDLGALNAGLAQAIAAGAVFSGVTPAQSDLERQFREAVRGGNA